MPGRRGGGRPSASTEPSAVDFAVEKSVRYSPLHRSTSTYHGQPWDVDFYSSTAAVSLHSTFYIGLHSTSVYTPPLAGADSRQDIQRRIPTRYTSAHKRRDLAP